MNAQADIQHDRSGARVAGSVWRRRIIAALDGMHGGTVRLQDAHGAVILGQIGLGHADGQAPLAVTLKVLDDAFYRRIALNGSVGAGESYIDGEWTCDDLVALVRLLVRNRDRLDSLETGPARFGAWALRGWEALRPNTRSGSRKNISAHYDLGNTLFGLFLTPDMMYSSAMYVDPDESLEDASFRKIDTICRKLQLESDDHVVEIGTGWGGFAIHAATRYGCRVTTTTLSREQRELAQERIASAGVGDRVTVLLDDYRDLTGRFDKLVSIEMIEAIGAAQLPTYFGKLSNLLKHDGLALVQAITIEDHRYERALKEVDFIKRHVFPGCFIPSVAAMTAAMARHGDLGLLHLEDIGASYALTLREWRRRFEAQRKTLASLGYDERFMRLWRFYLCYCEGGFMERSIGNVQMLFAKPGYRTATGSVVAGAPAA